MRAAQGQWYMDDVLKFLQAANFPLLVNLPLTLFVYTLKEESNAEETFARGDKFA